MCGIVGVLGNHEVSPIIVEALKKLEYRGYDSAGIATVNHTGDLQRRRAMGKLVNLSDLLVHKPLPGKSGIGHTRWATHGAPSEINAHPHQTRDVAVVHNGIIENFKKLRKELAKQDLVPETETDTETIVLLAQSYLDDGLSPVDAATKTLGKLEGAFALCFLFKGENDLMFAARKGSPLALGHGDGEMFVGSDAIALAPMTNQITYLEEGDYAVLTRNSAEIYDRHERLANRPIKTVSLDQLSVEKGGYKHFMAKEIAEQPRVVADAIAAYSAADGSGIVLPSGTIDFTKCERITMIACGTAHIACSVAKYWFEQLAGLPVEVDIASEFRYRNPPLSKKNYALFVSQSGETADTLEALRHCQDKVGQILSVVNIPESSIARESDVSLPILAGTEISVASTKAFTCQLTVLFSLALLAATQRGAITDAERARYMEEFHSLPGQINQALATEPVIKHAAKLISTAQDVLFLGRGPMQPLAMEGALKLKEISYIHAEGYAAGELKHGPIALVDKSVPIVIIAPTDPLFDKTISNMEEVKARQGRVVLMTDAKGAKSAGKGVWQLLVMPTIDPVLAPILYAIPAQLLSYHAAVAKGTDVDQPRNLAKSVTVE